MAMVMGTNDNYKAEIFGDEEFKVVLFGASWCGPCKMYHPIVHEYAAEHPELKIVANDVDQSTIAADMFEISSVPTTVIMKGGKEVARESGLMSKAQLDAFVKANR